MKKSSYQTIFISEAGDLLQTLNRALIDLEKEPADLRHVEEIFRAAHSLKGMSATMGYDNMARLTHTMESLLDLVRQRECAVTEGLVSLMFESLDTLQQLLDGLAAGKEEAPVDELIGRINGFQGQPGRVSPRLTKMPALSACVSCSPRRAC